MRSSYWSLLADASNDANKIVRGKGAYLYDASGKAYLDLFASGWVNIHGHGYPEILAAISAQFETLDHSFYGLPHQASEDFIKRLRERLPPSLNQFFFSETGSTAIEIALKMVTTYWDQMGQNKRRYFVHLDHSYHGSTLGAMSISSDIGWNSTYRHQFLKTISWDVPYTWQHDNLVDEKEKHVLEQVKTSLERHSDSIAAVVLEPLLQGVGGFRMYRASFLEDLMRLVKSYGVLIIFDEIVTGFGRLGTSFAVDQLAEKPDILCLAKAMTGGVMPMAVTVTNDLIRETIGDRFIHIGSYAANPLACAAASASLGILNSEATQLSIHNIKESHKRYLSELQSYDNVHNIRCMGTIAALDIDFSFDFNSYVRTFMLERGMLIGHVNNSFYMMPPYCVTNTELSDAYAMLADAIDTFS